MKVVSIDAIKLSNKLKNAAIFVALLFLNKGKVHVTHIKNIVFSVWKTLYFFAIFFTFKKNEQLLL